MDLETRTETTPILPALRASALLPGVGNTPLIRLQRVTRELAPGVEVFAKAEWHNPGGSVKDRPAAAILRQALGSGLLEDGKILLDSTSGNMGIAYATLGASLGIGVHLALPENASRQRHQILRALGAELTLTDPLEGSDGARIVAQELADRHPERTYFANQYENPANWQAHYLSTGPEIVEQTQGALTHFVAGLGTTGTLIGVGRFLNETLPDVKLVAVQPDQPFHGLEGLKHLPSSPIPGIFDPSIPDETVHIRTEAAYGMARRLAREEGLLVGVSSAAAALAAIEIGRRLEKGLIVTIFPDSGLKYLDEPFWSAG